MYPNGSFVVRFCSGFIRFLCICDSIIFGQFGRAPLVTDDNTAGFKVGDMWVNAGVVYAATSVSTGAAVWLVL